MSSTISTLSVTVSSTNQSPKNHAATDAQHKGSGKHPNNAHSTQTNDGTTKLTKYFARDVLHGANNVRRLK